MSTEVKSVKTDKKIEVDAEKRAFMKKFGKYAAVGAGMSVLMTPTASSANSYGGTCNPGDGGSIWDWFFKR